MPPVADCARASAPVVPPETPNKLAAWLLARRVERSGWFSEVTIGNEGEEFLNIGDVSRFVGGDFYV